MLWGGEDSGSGFGQICCKTLDFLILEQGGQQQFSLNKIFK